MPVFARPLPTAAIPAPARYRRAVSSRLLLVCALVCASLISAAPAGAANKDVWATVNVCDTKKAPNWIGLRASMPGIGQKGAKLLMRFQVQYRNGEGKWVLGKGLDTGFVAVGSATRARDAGHSFQIKGTKGSSYTMRGLVSFEWRSKGGKLLSSKQRITEAGHKSTTGADPKNYSAAACLIKL